MHNLSEDSVLRGIPVEQVNILKSIPKPLYRLNPLDEKLDVYEGGTKRLSISLPFDLYQRLQRRADIQKVSIAEVTRQSIERDLYLEDLVNQGCDLLYQSPDGKIHRLFPNH